MRRDYAYQMEQFRPGEHQDQKSYERWVISTLEWKAMGADKRRELPADSRAWEWLREQKARLL
jgi:hypothetical protein